MQAADPLQDNVLRIVRQVRRRHPNGPSCGTDRLHRLYPVGAAHPDTYPYTGRPEDDHNAIVAHPLRRALAYQRRLLVDLPGAAPQFVPLDFTLAEDGFQPQDFGVEALERVLSAECVSAYDAIHHARSDGESDRIRARSRRFIYGYGVAAAGAAPSPCHCGCEAASLRSWR